VTAKPRSIVAALAVAALCLPAAAVAGTPAHAAATCDISGKERKLGATYVTSLSVTGVSCAKAETFVKAFHKCRHQHGLAGRCTKKVDGYACRETREAIATQYDSRTTCTRGKRRIVQVYTQNT
jgi:hypothetical protein